MEPKSIDNEREPSKAVGSVGGNKSKQKINVINE